VVRAVKLVGFVNSTADFTDQPKVINGASDFLVAVLGDAGRHARSAVSAASLPLGVAVEIEGDLRDPLMTPRSLPDGFLRLPLAHRALHDRGGGADREFARRDPRRRRGTATRIEIDLQLSAGRQADGLPRRNLDRLTAETGPVNARTAAETWPHPAEGRPTPSPPGRGAGAGRRPRAPADRDQGPVAGHGKPMAGWRPRPRRRWPAIRAMWR
jgi:hypothetical protein